MPLDDLVGPAAANLAAWHTTNLSALGVASRRAGGWWLVERREPNIYFTACSLAPEATPDELARLVDARGYHAVCDSWANLDLSALGLTRRGEGTWHARPPGSVPVHVTADRSTDLVIGEVHSTDELVEWEHVARRSFDAPTGLPSLTTHAPPILRDPAHHVLAGRVDGRIVGVAMAQVAHDVVGVYGVGTLPEHRNRGYATALTVAALGCAPHLPSTLQPSPVAVRLYERLGYRPIGSHGHWGRGP